MPRANRPADLFHTFEFRGKRCNIYYTYRNDDMSSDMADDVRYHFNPLGSIDDDAENGVIDLNEYEAAAGETTAELIERLARAGNFDGVIEDYLEEIVISPTTGKPTAGQIDAVMVSDELLLVVGDTAIAIIHPIDTPVPNEGLIAEDPTAWANARQIRKWWNNGSRLLAAAKELLDDLTAGDEHLNPETGEEYRACVELRAVLREFEESSPDNSQPPAA